MGIYVDIGNFAAIINMILSQFPFRVSITSSIIEQHNHFHCDAPAGALPLTPTIKIHSSNELPAGGENTSIFISDLLVQPLLQQLQVWWLRRWAGLLSNSYELCFEQED